MKDADETCLGIEDLGHGGEGRGQPGPAQARGIENSTELSPAHFQSPRPMQTSAREFRPVLKMRSSTVTSWTNG